MLASLLLALWPTDVTSNCAPKENTLIVGVARDLQGNILYCEQVSQHGEEQLHIDYFENHKIFATKDLLIVTSPEKPKVIQKDFRTGEIRQALVTEQLIELHYKENSKKELESTKLETANIDVVDAGFDEFIRNHWQVLTGTKRKTTTIRFASIAHLRSLDLRIHQEELKDCTKNLTKKVSHFQVHATSNLEACFVVDIDNFLLRLLLGNMQLIYDKKFRLTYYLGPVNITSESGHTQTAEITYYYKE